MDLAGTFFNREGIGVEEQDMMPPMIKRPETTTASSRVWSVMASFWFSPLLYLVLAVCLVLLVMGENPSFSTILFQVLFALVLMPLGMVYWMGALFSVNDTSSLGDIWIFVGLPFHLSLYAIIQYMRIRNDRIVRWLVILLILLILLSFGGCLAYTSAWESDFPLPRVELTSGT